MLQHHLERDKGILLLNSRESRINTAIHMFFMFFPILVVWLNRDLIVVDIQIAKPWRPLYISKEPAMYTLEIHAMNYPRISIGDHFEIY